MPSAIVFDMDGVLVDSETLYQEAILLAAAEGGYTLDLDVVGRMTGAPWPLTRALLLAHFGESFPVDTFVEVWLRHYRVIAETRLALKPGVVELLDALDALRLPRGIATSSSPATVQHHLAATGIAGRFDAIVGAGDYPAGKPAPDPFLTAAKWLGVAPEACLALEDSHNGVRSASTAGMMTIMVPDLLPPTDDIRALCTGVAVDLHEVRRLVLAAAAN
jgi:HAD superfamily hydrolase (TIGR01509 family)